MQQDFSHRLRGFLLIFLFAFLFFGCVAGKTPLRMDAAGPSPVVGQQELTARIDAILSDPKLAASTKGVKVVRLRDQKVLYEKNSAKLFHPASTMKLFTTAAALRSLGPEFRFATRLMAETDSCRYGVMSGDLYLVGGGDPSLKTADLFDLAEQLASLGVRSVKGNLICDDSYFDDVRYGAGWMWDDQPYKDFAPIGALSVNRNTVSLFVSPGSQPTAPVQVRQMPQNAFTKIFNQAITAGGGLAPTDDPEKEKQLTVLRRWQEQSNDIEVNGSMPAESGEVRFERNIVFPALYTGSLFKEQCAKNGIKISGDVVRGEAPAGAMTIAEHLSPELTQIIIEMNKESHNLYAELLLKTLAAQIKEPPGTAAKGIEVLNDMLTEWGVAPQAYRFADGSGVSRYGLVATDTLVTLLTKVYADFDIRHEFINSLAIAGVDGSLKERMQGTSAQRKVHAKTGSLSGVSALAGYTETLDNDAVAFTIMMEHFIDSTDEHLAAQDRICDLLSRFVSR